MDKRSITATALYQAELGKMVLDYVGQIDPTVIEKAMESRAVQTLEAIRCVLENDRLSDPDCVRRVENLIRLFFQELDLKINRHNELK